MKHQKLSTLRLWILSIAVVVSVIVVSNVFAGHAVDGVDVKVTNDNNNVDGGTPNPSFDAQNHQGNESTISISPTNPNIVAAGANDYGMVTVAGDVWLGVYVSADGGVTWFNTMVPGFPSDTSAAGLTSPLLGLDASGAPAREMDSAHPPSLSMAKSTSQSSSRERDRAAGIPTPECRAPTSRSTKTGQRAALLPLRSGSAPLGGSLAR